jgi:hypothetical protein
MIANKEKITNIRKKYGELFFLYDEKYKWSINYNDEREDYCLYYYKTDVSIDDLVTYGTLSGTELVSYRAKDIGTKEAFSTFRDLFQILKEKLVGIEKVLNDIIDEEGPL